MEVVSQGLPDCISREKVSLESEFCDGSKSSCNRTEDSNLPSPLQETGRLQTPAKKPTRQWAAWTRQEEESFFSALRHVGKNFEKITCRVQSKNKDQVRHYYYRLVRRMNKLLGPELCLDAKNSKDTNAAMLRWWSLLEKYSCKASKLHLKPRRFKIFVETLENQLLRDRKKSTKRRVSTGESNSSFSNSSSDQNRAIGHESSAVKMVLVDRPDIQKVSSGKGVLFKRPASVGTRKNCKLGTGAVKTSSHRQKAASAAAYIKWEKAAIAGVTLVADAAEHLERSDTDKDIDNFGETLGSDGPQPAQEVGCASSSSPHSMLKENSAITSVKLKLQLFPVDESTRRALEMGNHNPHLELTLSTRKKISSVLEHLDRKWKNSSFSSQELVLFPFWAQGENLMGYQKWTKDSPLCAADVYFSVGTPLIFRLRYGWFLRDLLESAPSQSLPSTRSNEKILSISIATRQNAEAGCGPPATASEFNSSACNDRTADVSPECKDNVGISSDRQIENMGMELSAGEWADSLTNVSMGDLLCESAPIMDVECHEHPIPPVSNSMQMPFSCDSFDAAIAAHIYKHQNSAGGHVSNAPAIWEAEDTCDAFAFRKAVPSTNNDNCLLTNHGISKLVGSATPPASHDKFEELPEPVKLPDHDRLLLEDPVNCSIPDHQMVCEPNKDFSGLTDMYWPDSLGPLDLEMPSCRYSMDLILSDSLSGFNRFLANSLDPFHPPASTTDPCQSSSFSDFKIRSEV